MSALASLCGRAEARALRTSRASARASRDEGALRFEIPVVHLRSAWSILDDGRGGRMQVCSVEVVGGKPQFPRGSISLNPTHLKTRSLGDLRESRREHARDSCGPTTTRRPTTHRPTTRREAIVTAMFTLEARKPPPDQETLRLEVSPEDSVAALKIRIATQRHGWSADQMNVILQGAFLQDPKTMAECGLKDGDFVVITGMVSRDMRRPAGEAEGPLQEMPDEMLPLFSIPVVLNELPTDQRIDRT